MKKLIILVAALAAAAHAAPPISAPDSRESLDCWPLHHIAAAMQAGKMEVSEEAIRAKGCTVFQSTTLMLKLGIEKVVVRKNGVWKLNGETK